MESSAGATNLIMSDIALSPVMVGLLLGVGQIKAFTHYIGFPVPKFQSFRISRLPGAVLTHCSPFGRAETRRTLHHAHRRLSLCPEKTERCLRHFHVLNFSSNESPGRNSRLQTRRDCAVGEAHSGLARSGSRSW